MTITIENNKLSIAFFKPWHFVSYNLDGLFKLLLCWVVILFYFLPYKSIFWKKKLDQKKFVLWNWYHGVLKENWISNPNSFTRILSLVLTNYRPLGKSFNHAKSLWNIKMGSVCQQMVVVINACWVWSIVLSTSFMVTQVSFKTTLWSDKKIIIAVICSILACFPSAAQGYFCELLFVTAFLISVCLSRVFSFSFLWVQG